MAQSNRDNFPDHVRETVAQRVAYKCSRPECKRVTSGPHSDPRKSLKLGVAAHIIAAAARGPRASADISSDDRKSIENAIWLCTECSTLIDKDESRYPVELLREWKSAAEEAARHELERTLADPLSVLQTPQAFPPHEDVFHPHVLREAFTGRAPQRHSLTRWWREDGPPVHVLVGMGGLGKSSLAWVWMHEDVLGTDVVGQPTKPTPRQRKGGLRPAERPDGVLWWSFYAPELQIQESFELFVDRALAYVTGGQIQPEKVPTLNKKISDLLDRLREKRFLIILDGFERATKLYEHLAAPHEADQLEHDPETNLFWCSDACAGKFLCDVAAVSRSRVLITSRVYPADIAGVANAKRHNLEALNPEESLKLFHACDVEGSDSDILKACTAAGHHPLALRLMIGYVMNTAGPYRGRIESLPETPLEVTPEHQFRHIFNVAYKELDPREKDFFSRISVYTHAASYPMLRACSPYHSGEETANALERLERRGFLSYDRQHRTYDMHPMVRQYAYAQMPTTERREAARKTYRYLADRLPKHETTLATLSVTLEVYHQALQGGLVASAHKIFLHRLYPILFFRIGQCRIQIALMEQLIAAGKEHPEQISAGALRGLMDRLGTAYILAGMPREAYRCALEASNGGDKANRLVYLASSEMRLGKLQSAVQQLEESVRLNLQNGESFAEMIAHLNLGLALTWSAQFEEAATHLDSASAIIGDTPKRRHWHCIFLVHHARLALLMGRGTRALQHARTAHEIATEDSDETDLVRSRWALGASLVRRVEEDPALAAEYLSEAESHLLSALSTCSESHYGEFTMELNVAMAHWHFANGDPAQAEVAAESALTLARKGGHAVKEAEADEILSELARLATTGSIQDGAGAESTDLRPADQAVAIWSLSSVPRVKSLRPDPRS